VGEAGAILASIGARTVIGCDIVPVVDWLSGVRRVGLDGADLVLVDRTGKELSRLTRAV
jgi:hypothetical protein